MVRVYPDKPLPERRLISGTQDIQRDVTVFTVREAQMNREDAAPLSPALAVGKPDAAYRQGMKHDAAQPTAKLFAARAVGFKVARG